MQELDSVIAKFKNAENGIADIIKQTIMENEILVCEMNSEDQLYEKGITKDNTDIASYAPYSPVTVFIKKKKGQITTHVTLRDEGDFHRSFYIEFHPDSFEIAASDWKTQDLKKGYGPEIFGLTDENFFELAEYYIKPALIKYFRDL